MRRPGRGRSGRSGHSGTRGNAVDVLEELTEFEDQIDRAHIERRIEDWKQRIDALYANVVRWLPAGWSAVPCGDVVLHDELMQRFGVPDQSLPVLRIERSGAPRGRFEPRGLWIIGANGRIDLVLPPQHFIIIDRAQNFEASQWTMTSLRNRLDEPPFTAESLKASLG